MTIDEPGVIDVIGTDKVASHVVLVISDHRDWADPDAHLELLQAKINTYLRFIESGEMLQEYPAARGRVPVIKVVGAHPLPAEGIAFFEQALPIVREAGFELQFELLAEVQN